MKVVVVGASGTIGKEVAKRLEKNHQVVRVGHRSGDYQLDLASKASIEDLYRNIGTFDGLVCAAGLAKFGSLDELSDEDYGLALSNKLMGQVNLVRVGHDFVSDNGSFTLTSGLLGREPIPGSSSITMVNAGLEGFVRAAALELSRGVRVNAVSPVFVKETLEIMGMDSATGMPAEQVALAYRESVEGQRNGEVLDVRDFV